MISETGGLMWRKRAEEKHRGKGNQKKSAEIHDPERW